MTRTPLDTRTLADRVHAAARGFAAGEPQTDDQRRAYADGQERHAAGLPRPAGPLAEVTYGTEMPWFVRGWADAAALADSQAKWDQGLAVGAVPTGVHTTANDVQHTPTREVHPDATGRPDQFSWSCSCGAAGSYHRSSPLPDAAWHAAREWTAHVWAIEERIQARQH